MTRASGGGLVEEMVFLLCAMYLMSRTYFLSITCLVILMVLQ